MVPAGASAQVSHQGAPAPLPDRRLDVLEDDLAALAVELDCAAGRKEGEAVLDLLRDAAPAGIDDRPQPLLEAELRAVLADQVDHGEVALPLRPAQPAPELLGEQGGRLGRAEQQQAVDVGDVDTLAEHLDREDAAQLAATEPVEHGGAGGRVVLAAQRDALQARLAELPRHEASVLHGYAEPQRPHPAWLVDDPLNRLEQLRHPLVVAAVEVAELLGRVARRGAS